jgi:hypothetical protein
MESQLVGGGIDSDRRDREFMAGADNPQGNFTSVGYQYLLEHALTWPVYGKVR